jgi:hypothetical protein
MIAPFLFLILCLPKQGAFHSIVDRVDCSGSSQFFFLFHSRCVLLATLRPQEYDVLIGEASESPTGNFLVFLPLLLFSRAFSDVEANRSVKSNLDSPLNGDDTEFKSRLRSLLTNFLGEVLVPTTAALAKSAQSESYTSALPLSIERFEWLRQISESGEKQMSTIQGILYDAATTLKYLSGELIPASIESKLICGISPRQTGASRFLQEIKFSVNTGAGGNHKSPHFRLLSWKCIAEECVRCPPGELRQHVTARRAHAAPEVPLVGDAATDGSSAPSSFSWLLVAPFADTDPSVREYSSREIGRTMMANDCSFLLALFATDEEFLIFNQHVRTGNRLNSELGHSGRLLNACDNVASRLFREVDRLLREKSVYSDSQMSLTIGKSSASETSQSQKSMRSALRSLASFCRFADFSNPCGKFVFEKALLRIVRIWAATQVGRSPESPFPDLCTSPGRALAFGELSRLSCLRPTGLLIRKKSPERLTAALFCDILILSSGEGREMQYRLLETFIRSVITSPGEISEVPGEIALMDELEFLEEKLPAVVAQFVAEKDYELLCLTTGFKEYIDGKKRALSKIQKGYGRLVGGTNMPPRRKIAGVSLSMQELKKKTKNLCLEPNMIDRILPLIFINSDHSGLGHPGLKFFTGDVLQDMALHEIVKNREQPILKGFVWELGRDPDMILPAARALRTAAVSRFKVSKLPDERALIDSGVSPASRWVTDHFMYLLVNLIQYKWNTRPAEERLHALRCLNGLLDFLLPAEASQYLPQIMASVNVAIVQGNSSENSRNDGAVTTRLRLLAVQALSKFVRLVVAYQWETIAQNLTTIVVSIIPVLESDDQTENFDEDWAVEESSKVAVSLLEYVTQGEVGKKLANFFREVPFLPPSSALETVRRALRSNGVDLDNLILLSSGSQQVGTKRDSLTSEGTLGSNGSSMTSRNSDTMIALQKRLAMVCSLLDNENVSVRRVVLRHLTDLLRANRGLFQAVIDNEGSTSVCMTVSFRDASRKEVSANENAGKQTKGFLQRRALIGESHA